MKVILPIVLLFLLFCLRTFAQETTEIRIDVQHKPLNEVLLDLKENFALQFAYDKDLLSTYSVTVNRSFYSEEEALQYLLKGLPLQLEKSGNVFLIFPQLSQKQMARKNPFTKISGQVMEVQTYEPLPFSYILINDKPVQSDRQGHFSFLASADTTFDMQISHLGYFIYDTLFTGGLSKQFFLTPRVEQISEVMVEGNPVEHSTLIGDRPGKMKINHRIAPILPGYGDNSVFNLLRLMPGVMASGEQSNDLIIWGSYESHSRIQFDGFTVFGLKNFNDNISVVNPFVVKNIDVYKGGYGAKFGDRVGGVVDITGKNGNLHKPAFTFNINNTTVNSLLEVPLSERSSLLAAYRQTYYQLYDPT
ncbi:MAG TPA: TonB-dependent receptor plug domain-containing protein, partial [Prolixibacteraceae bacterium]|nr:TonB-dependent receptor plug domain-containing protein [Prolixibacteraceae bacterium]